MLRLGFKPDILDELTRAEVAAFLEGDAARHRWWRGLVAWAVVSLANMEMTIQASIAAGKVPEPFTLADVLGEEPDGDGR